MPNTIYANDKVVKNLLDKTKKLAEEWEKVGVNLFQPGAIKEVMAAQILGHAWISSKHDADACDVDDPSVKYEYLSGSITGAGQIDRVFKDDQEDEIQHRKHVKSMERIERNDRFYLMYTNPENPIDILRIYDVPTSVIKEEVEKQLANSGNNISHVSFKEKFAKENGTLVWEK